MANSYLRRISTDNYTVLCSENEVLVYSNIKIPFEPNNEQAALRKIIIDALKEFKPAENAAICAEYGSISSRNVDIENALFYNIGTASFSKILSRNSPVYFERIQPNELCDYDGFSPQYFYRYYYSRKGNQKFWWEHELICEWNCVPLKTVNSTLTVFDYFLALKNNPKLIKSYTESKEANLGLKIQLFIPKNARFSNLVRIMKPMIDGIICSFHSPNLSSVDKISKLLNVNPKLLTSKDNTCLGKYCYVNLYRNFVKWNPQDERLDYVFIEPVIVDDLEFSFSGRIFSIPCYM